jgi:hypothetical protein
MVRTSGKETALANAPLMDGRAIPPISSRIAPGSARTEEVIMLASHLLRSKLENLDCNSCLCQARRSDWVGLGITLAWVRAGIGLREI